MGIADANHERSNREGRTSIPRQAERPLLEIQDQGEGDVSRGLLEELGWRGGVSGCRDKRRVNRQPTGESSPSDLFPGCFLLF